MTSNSVPQLGDLSDEILLRILSYLGPRELTRLRSTCRRLHGLIGDQRIWENLLFRDYGLTRDYHWDGWSAEEIYVAVHKFRRLFGLWYCEVPQFGMILLVKPEKDGIVGYECSPPLDDYVLDIPGIQNLVTVNNDVHYDDTERLHYFRHRRLFALAPDASNGTYRSFRFMCYHSPPDGHSAAAAVGSACLQNGCDTVNGNCLNQTETGYEFTCSNKDDHRQPNVRWWLEWEHGFRLNGNDDTSLEAVLAELRSQKDYDLRLEKFEAKSSLDRIRLSRRIGRVNPSSEPASASATSPLSTFPSMGLYFGHFCWHGWELLNIFVADDGFELVGEKVTGDQMIPVGRTSFRVDLRKPVQLNLDDQATTASIRAAVKRISQPHGSSAANGRSPTATPQAFRVPSDYTILGTRRVPDFAVSFFMAEGQIAFPNYCNPRYLTCIFVVFDHKQIGLLWLDLRCFMPMFKVLNPFCL